MLTSESRSVPDRRTIAFIGITAVAVRSVWVIATHRAPGGLSDPLLYQRFAQGIAAGDGYVSINGLDTAYYPPGYPYFLGIVQWIADGIGFHNQLPLLAGLVQAFLGGVTAVATVIAAARVGGARVGVAAGFIMAAWPNLVIYTSTLLSESLFLACVSVFAASILTLASERAPIEGGVGDRGALCVAAGSFGAATLVRPQVLLLLPALAMVWILCRRDRRTARVLAALVCGVVLSLAPWTIRNLIVMDAFVPLSTNGGDNLCVGFHEGAPGHFVIPPECETGELYIDGPAAELRRDAETTARARRWASGHLGALPMLSLRKLRFTYENDHDGLRAVESYEQDRFLPAWIRVSLRWISDGWYASVMVCSVGGWAVIAARARRRRRHGDRATPDGAAPNDSNLVDATLIDATLVAITLASVVVPVMFFGDARFKVPSTPLFAIAAAVAIDQLVNRRRSPTGYGAASST